MTEITLEGRLEDSSLALLRKQQANNTVRNVGTAIGMMTAFVGVATTLAVGCEDSEMYQDDLPNFTNAFLPALVATIVATPALGYLAAGVTKAVQSIKNIFPTKRKTMDEQFHASYESLATRTLQGDSLDELSTDYKDSFHLDLLTALLDQRVEESYEITERLSPLGKGIARNIVREKHKSLPTEVLKQYFEGDILSAPDVANMVTASLNQGETERANVLYELVKGKVSYDVRIKLRDNVIDQYLESPENRIRDAERLLDDVPTETVNGFRDRPMLVKVATAYLCSGEVECAERIYRRLGDRKALATTVADAYRSVGNNDKAARLFAEFSK